MGVIPMDFSRDLQTECGLHCYDLFLLEPASIHGCQKRLGQLKHKPYLQNNSLRATRILHIFSSCHVHRLLFPRARGPSSYFVKALYLYPRFLYEGWNGDLRCLSSSERCFPFKSDTNDDPEPFFFTKLFEKQLFDRGRLCYSCGHIFNYSLEH